MPSLPSRHEGLNDARGEEWSNEQWSLRGRGRIIKYVVIRDFVMRIGDGGVKKLFSIANIIQTKKECMYVLITERCLTCLQRTITSSQYYSSSCKSERLATYFFFSQKLQLLLVYRCPHDNTRIMNYNPLNIITTHNTLLGNRIYRLYSRRAISEASRCCVSSESVISPVSLS